MTLIVPNNSNLLMLEYILNKRVTNGGATSASGDRKLKLFKNNLVPSKSTIMAELIEATEAGYSSITLSGSLWTVTSVEGVNSANYPQQIFNFTESASIYGYYVTNLTGTELLWVERFEAAPFRMPSAGGDIGITLNFTLN